jgi:hypothetical protein
MDKNESSEYLVRLPLPRKAGLRAGREFGGFIFLTPNSSLRTLDFNQGGDLMLWIMDGPERGTIQSSKFKVQG